MRVMQFAIALVEHIDFYLFARNSSTVIPACRIKLLSNPGANSR
ncbi:hypothetical protein [Scytonema millei]|nr:hypothetical protein [Scytonema millei]